MTKKPTGCKADGVSGDQKWWNEGSGDVVAAARHRRTAANRLLQQRDVLPRHWRREDVPLDQIGRPVLVEQGQLLGGFDTFGDDLEAEFAGKVDRPAQKLQTTAILHDVA